MIVSREREEELPETPMQCLVQLLAEYGVSEIEAITVWVDLEDMVTRRIRMKFSDGSPGISFDAGGGSFFCIKEAT